MIKEIILSIQFGIFLSTIIIILMVWYARKENPSTKRFFQLAGIFYIIMGIYFIDRILVIGGIILFIYMTLFYYEPKQK